MEFKRSELIDELSKRTRFYKNSTGKLLDALGDTIIYFLSQAEIEEDAKVEITKGCWICARRAPEREALDPRNLNVITTPEKNIPYAKFTVTFKQKINE